MVFENRASGQVQMLKKLHKRIRKHLCVFLPNKYVIYVTVE